MSFFKEHKVLGIFLVLILVFVVTMCTIRWVRKANGTFKDRNETNQTQQMDTQDTQQEQINTSIKEDTEEEYILLYRIQQKQWYSVLWHA